MDIRKRTRRAAALLLSALLALGLPLSRCGAEGFSLTFDWSAQWEYEVRDDDTVIITGVSGAESKVEIPSTLGGKPVTAIADRALKMPSGMEEVRIPDSVTEIGVNLFYDCSQCRDLIVSPDHPALEVVDGALYSKADKRLICCPRKRGKGTFAVKEGTEVIGGYAFAENKQLTGVKLPASLKEIGEHAFLRCKKLKKVTIPDSVTAIGYGAFDSCENLTAAVLPAGLKEADSLFSHCVKLQKVTIPEGVVSMQGTFMDCTALTGVKLPQSLKRLGNFVFWGCKSLSSVNLPDNLEDIGQSTFEGCGRLKKLRIPDRVRTISEWAFRDCKGLTEVTLPDSLEHLWGNPFGGCPRVKLVLPENHPYLEFRDGILFTKADNRLVCRLPGFKAKEYDVPEGTTAIERDAFMDCKTLERVTIPDSVETIGTEAFRNCKNLKAVRLPRGLTVLQSYLFENTALEEIELPEGLTEVGYGAFTGCKKLKSVECPDTVVTVGSFAFARCGSLTSVVLPAGVQEIGTYAFKDSRKVTVSVAAGSYAQQFCEEQKIRHTVRNE